MLLMHLCLKVAMALQIPISNSGHERVPQTSKMPSVAKNAQPSHGTDH